MAGKSRDKTDEVMSGLDTLIDAGRVDEVEQVLSELVDSELDDPSDEEREVQAYARGVRDGLALARRLPENAEQ